MHRVSEPSPYKLIEGKEEAIVSSWHRLLAELRKETDRVRTSGSGIIPEISFDDLQDEQGVENFVVSLKKHGVGIVRGVVPKHISQDWMKETRQYISQNTSGDLRNACQRHEIFWSPAQVRARAHPNVLEAQRLLLDLWHISGKDPLTPNFPITYADSLQNTRSDSSNGSTEKLACMGDIADRWVTRGRASAYQEIWDGRWEDHDSWASRKRLETSSSREETCSAVQFWKGLFCLEGTSPDRLRICPLLHVSTAYVSLRPFFKPMTSPNHPEYLSADNWKLQSHQSSPVPGAGLQGISSVLHPHLSLPETLLPISLQPGDYLIYHPEVISAPQPSSNTTMALPICPLTRINALYLLRQRKAFLLGQPPPDFQQSRADDSRWDGRPGVQEISETGGEDALRAMGLAPWDEDDVEGIMEAEVIEDANNVLFPDRHGFGMGRT